jgi:signal transduction histidine kinase/CheY-like chemotaxis protein
LRNTMSDANKALSRETVLLLTPVGNDYEVSSFVLREAGIATSQCRDIRDLCHRLESQPWGAVVISEEAITSNDTQPLQRVLENQEPWSDIPIILLTKADVVAATEIFSKSGNIFLLERPFSRLTFVRSLEVALRARRKQYQVWQLLADLEKSKNEAHRANFAKTEFLANMSHEIRTPIGAIVGFADLMKNQNDPQENQKYAGIIERNSQHLLRLIDDILDLSKVEVGKMSLENIKFSLPSFLADLKSIKTYQTNQKGIGFRLNINSDIPEEVTSDPVRFKQILSNIIGNAIKFTEKGSVTVDLEYKKPFLEFTITDTGIGLTKEQATHLFQAFSQGDSSTTRKFGGTGLGLVLAKHLAELLGGTVELKRTAPQQGSQFLIRLRPTVDENVKMIKPAELNLINLPMTKRPKKVLEGLDVLLVEDSIDNRNLISLVLEHSGAKVTTAVDGLEGVKTALEGRKKFDVVLMDIQMPQMDGLEATKTLRRQKYSTPVVALTAHAMKEERDRCIASGFNDYLTKPIQTDRLVSVLEKYRTH